MEKEVRGVEATEDELAEILAEAENNIRAQFPDADLSPYTYSFSTNEDDKLTSGEETWASRYLTTMLRSGTTIDSWKYTALSGRFYEFRGIFTEPLAETQVYELNSIFGIE